MPYQSVNNCCNEHSAKRRFPLPKTHTPQRSELVVLVVRTVSVQRGVIRTTLQWTGFKKSTQLDVDCPYLHICYGFQLLLLLRFPPLEILHKILDVTANLCEVQVHVL